LTLQYVRENAGFRIAFKGVVRPTMPLCDAILAAVFKVYSTLSARRFMSDLREAHERGHVYEAYSGPHCLDQKKAFLSYTPEASVAPRPLPQAGFFRPALPSPGLREGGAEKPVPLQRPRRYTTSGVLYSKD